MSRMMPPPTAVIMPSVTTPTMSTCTARTAVSAPFTANANVPTRSNTNSAGITAATARSTAPRAAATHRSRSGPLQPHPVRSPGAHGRRELGQRAPPPALARRAGQVERQLTELLAQVLDRPPRGEHLQVLPRVPADPVGGRLRGAQPGPRHPGRHRPGQGSDRDTGGVADLDQGDRPHPG